MGISGARVSEMRGAILLIEGLISLAELGRRGEKGRVKRILKGILKLERLRDTIMNKVSGWDVIEIIGEEPAGDAVKKLTVLKETLAA